MYKRALVSVSDKTGLEEFLKPLVQQGLELVSTGGTGAFLKSKGFKLIDVKDVTAFPEVLSGRVKTLHPHIHISLLAREWVQADKEVLKQYKLQPFDLVIGNLYPFEKKSENLEEDKELVEWIDVGGPSFLRAAAKNYFSITTVCDPADYPEVQKGTNLEMRKTLAGKVFQKLSEYDSVIAQKLLAKKESQTSSQTLNLKAHFFKKLRYGENPHQTADWYHKEEEGLHSADILQGKELSYNNILDLCSAVTTLRDFKEPCAVAVKHNNPCGVGLGDNLFSALQKALSADPLSVFGGVIALNQPLDKASAELFKNLFFEGLIAPDFSSSALQVLKSKKNLRILKWPNMMSVSLAKNSFREVLGGVLWQTTDQVTQTWSQNWKVIGSSPSEELKKDLLFAWKLCAHLKSNAIAIVKQGQSLGLGMGQVSRVSAVRLALSRVQEFHPSKAKDLILASDAFFPFPDSIELAAQGAVSWLIQPGGSVRDEEVIKKAEELKLNMILTGQRHFKH